jgi:threonine aldolase
MKPCVLNQTYSEKIVTQLAHIKDTESGKLRFYSKIYQQFQIQKYLTFGINKHLRSFLDYIQQSVENTI